MAEPLAPNADAGTRLYSPQIPRQMVADLLTVSQVPVETLSRIAEEFGRAEGFLFANRLSTILSPFGFDPTTADAILTTVFRLRPRSTEQVVRELQRWRDASTRNAELLPEDAVAAIRERLEILVRDYPTVERTRKAAALAGMTGNRCDTVDILCDLRPVFDPKRESIDGLLPIVTLRLGYTTQDDEDGTVELRLDEATLAELAAKVETAHQKLAALRKYADRWVPDGWASDSSAETEAG